MLIDLHVRGFTGSRGRAGLLYGGGGGFVNTVFEALLPATYRLAS